VQRGHAVANACYLACVNRVGFEENPEDKGRIDFWGKSYVADLNGQVLKEASGEEKNCCFALLISHGSRRSETAFPSLSATEELTVMMV
jgi:N-carbamoylputrescine amidase